MAFCGKCGKQIEDGTGMCPECKSAQNKGGAVEKLQNLNNTKDSTAEFTAEDIQQNKVMAVLAYFSWLVLVPIFGAKESKFARFHVNQGLVLAIAEILWAILYSVLSAILYSVSWRLGMIVSSIIGIVSIGFAVLSIIGIINAANGRAKELPVVGKIKILK